jgi:branched-chain amino acid transport system permease protein
MTSPDIFSILFLGIMMGGVYGLTAMGFSLVWGVLRLFNLSNGSWTAICLYLTFWFFVLYGVFPYFSIFLVVPILFICGVVFYRVLVEPFGKLPRRERMVFVVLSTFGLNILLQNIILQVWHGDIRGIVAPELLQTVVVGSTSISVARLFAFGASMVAYVVLGLFFSRSKHGKALIAIVQDREAAELCGVKTRMLITIGIGLGFAVTGLSGVLLSPLVNIYPEVGGTFFIYNVTIVTLGGIGSLYGSLVGGIIIGILEIVIGRMFGSLLIPLVLTVIYIVFLVIRPKGLFGRA